MVPAILKQLWLHLQTQFVCNLSARVFNVQNYKYASKAPYVRSMQIIYRKKNSNAHFNFRRNDHSPKKFLMIFGFLMPCIVIIACYSAIFLKVRQSRKNVQSHMKNRWVPISNNCCASSSWVFHILIVFHEIFINIF